MTSKRVAVFLAAYAFSIVLFGRPAEATITSIVCGDSVDDPYPAELWSFDYDLQVLTLTLSFNDIHVEPHYSSPPHFLRVGGTIDSQSVFNVTESILNETGVPLTGYSLYLGNTPGTWSDIVAGSVQATGSAQVYQHSLNYYELLWSEPIPHGGGFTIQFDVVNYLYNEDLFLFSLGEVVVPEPATIMLLGFGGLVGVRISKQR